MSFENSVLNIFLASAITLFARCSPLPQATTGVTNGTGVQTNDTPSLITHEGYTLLYSEIHEQPYWVAYTLTKDEVYGKAPRKDDFREDLSVPTGSAELSDYKGSGFDRGHLKPAADSKYSVLEMSESFFLSNMSPQKESFNREIWSRLEDQVREYAVDFNSISIVTGPVLKNPIGSIGKNEVSVPEAFYKVILNSDSTRSIGFLLPHENSSKALSTFAVSVDSIEKVTGFHFFSGVNQSVKMTFDYSLW